MAEAHEVPPHRLWVDYWHASSRPLVSLVFVMPMLLAYEGGLLLLGTQAMRNGADLWLRRWLEWLGFGQYFLLPSLTCGLLLAWHHLQRDRWHIAWDVVCGMFLECTGLAFFLMFLAQLQGNLLADHAARIPCTLDAPGTPWGFVVAFVGAGIYEELLFRLMLLPAAAALLRLGGLSRGASLALSVLVTSAVFAAAHYRIDMLVGPYHLLTRFGEPFHSMSFLFRILAGVFFSLVFLYRGFGIAAGTHAIYDLLVFVF